MCQKKQSRAPVPLLHLPYISTPRQIPSQADTTMLRVLSYVGEATPGKRLPLNSPPTGDSESRGLFKGFPADRVHALQCTGLGWAVGGPVWVWRCGSSTGSFAVGFTCWHHLPRRLHSTLSSLGIRDVQAPEKCHQARCPRPDGNNIGILFFLLNLFFPFYGNIDDFPCELFGIDQPDSFIHMHISIVFQMLFPYMLQQYVVWNPCAIHSVLVDYLI